MEKIIASNIVARRTTLNLSQEKAAEQCGISTRNYGRIERGEGNPTLTVLVKIIDGLSMTWEQLGADGEKNLDIK